MIEQDEIQTYIDDCAQRESKMSPWEQEFVQSISEQFSRTQSLSVRQNETLEKIWDKVT